MIPLPMALAANWKAILGGLLLTALALQTWRVGRLKDDVAAELSAHVSDIAFWKQAGVIAVTRAKASKARIEAAQNKVTSHANDDYQRRVAAWRLRFTPTADSGGAGKADLPRLAINPSVYHGPGSDRVLSGDDARICGEVTLRLLAAQQWVIDQSQIDRSE